MGSYTRAAGWPVATTGGPVRRQGVGVLGEGVTEGPGRGGCIDDPTLCETAHELYYLL